VPYMLVVGEKEMHENKLAVRKHGIGDQGQKPVKAFISEVSDEIAQRRST